MYPEREILIVDGDNNAYTNFIGNEHKRALKKVSWCFEPSQPQSITAEKKKKKSMRIGRKVNENG